MISISRIWNTSMEQGVERPIVPRAKIWASELGKSDIDIYLKLMGTEVTNPFDSRSRRKFEAGNLFEWVVKLIFIRCGVYKESQKWLGYKMPGCSLEVSGRLDHLIGGVPRYGEARKAIEELELPESFTKAAEEILKYFEENYPDGIEEQGVEVKSTSSFGIEKVYFTEKALAGHDLQAFHYAYNTKLPFTLLYICRDDLRMAEIPILPDDKSLLERYENKIKTVSGYFDRKEEPAIESPIVFDEESLRFSKNFNVEYSSYLTRNYGMANPEEFSDTYGSTVEKWNRVLGRMKEGKELTDNNKANLEEMAKWNFDVEIISNKLKNEKQ